MLITLNTRLLILLWLLFCGGKVIAQHSYRVGLLPSVNFNKKLPDRWSLNLKIESRQRLQQGSFDTPNNWDYTYVLTDFSLLAARKIGLNAKISVGYLLRLRDGNLIHRAIQQYAIVQKLTGFRLAHRLAADQTFTPNAAPEFRARYRITLELPLNGQEADSKEFYIKINHEYLNSLEDGQYDLELRLVPLLGYSFTDKHKIETGLDYRISSFIALAPSHSFRWVVNWYYSF